ncbi:MAG TPA: GNAT family N-acetyltransferase [Candidatus Baltobacteraceae bacterium]|jgi:ribosomal-protein-alanine N-acetyltransferase|nr:GNAT family N-acetyltransferase [Candidatus Baltobacteraceae bacterium]
MQYEVAGEMPVLQTSRLSLQIAGPNDAERCARFNAENADFLAPWEPTVASTSTNVGALRVGRERAVNEARAGLSFSFAIFPVAPQADSPILGWLNLTNVIHGVFEACNMGYKLDRRMQGNGYMTEAATAGIGFAFAVLNLHRIMAAYMPHNQRSAALLRRLGFTTEGVARDYLYIGGDWRDHVLTSLVNPQAIVPGSVRS